MCGPSVVSQTAVKQRATKRKKQKNLKFMGGARETPAYRVREHKDTSKNRKIRTKRHSKSEMKHSTSINNYYLVLIISVKTD